MRRYWLESNSRIENQFKIEGEAFHHIFDVCRQEQGSKFEVLLGDQKAYLTEVVKVDKKSALVQIISERLILPLAKPHIHLAISFPRYHVMDAVIEKAVEMGVHTIHPFYSQYSFIRSDKSFPIQKMQRWKKIVVSATQQSGRGELLQIVNPVEFEVLLNQFNQSANTLGLFAYEGDSAQNIQQELKKAHLKKPDNYWIFVGSEGGFSSSEVQLFQQAGLPSVTLGDQVLRVETACIALISVLKYELELMR
jgi:16S rRNA (uracil1498-N3)-methyltransferase